MLIKVLNEDVMEKISTLLTQWEIHQLLMPSTDNGPVIWSFNPVFNAFCLSEKSCESNSQVASCLRCHDAEVTSL